MPFNWFANGEPITTKCVLRSKATMFLFLFSYLSQLMLQVINGDTVVSILLYTAITAM